MNDPRIKFFDGLAAEWDHGEQDPGETIRRLEELGDLLRLQPGLDVLEVGCGTGQVTGWLAARVAPGRVTAIDFSVGMLAQARSKGIEAAFLRCDVCRDELARESVDVVFCFHSFPHFRDQRGAMRNLARVIRRRGRIVVVHLASIEAINTFHDRVGGAVAGDHLPDEAGWNELLAENNLRRTQWIDREGLFFLEAEKTAANFGPSRE